MPFVQQGSNPFLCTMNLILHRYLLEHHRLDLPGLGTIRLERLPATYDFGAGLLHGPSFVGRFSTEVEPSNAHFDAYLSDSLSMPIQEARTAFQTYLKDLNQELETNGVSSALPIGQLKRLSTGELVLEASSAGMLAPAPVTASRIIRSMQTENTAPSPVDLPAATNRWWLAAVVLAVLALVIMLVGRIQSNSWLFNP
jgi:hypothetical protein